MCRLNTDRRVKSKLAFLSNTKKKAVFKAGDLVIILTCSPIRCSLLCPSTTFAQDSLKWVPYVSLWKFWLIYDRPWPSVQLQRSTVRSSVKSLDGSMDWSNIVRPTLNVELPMRSVSERRGEAAAVSALNSVRAKGTYWSCFYGSLPRFPSPPLSSVLCHVLAGS